MLAIERSKLVLVLILRLSVDFRSACLVDDREWTSLRFGEVDRLDALARLLSRVPDNAHACYHREAAVKASVIAWPGWKA